MQRKFVLGRCTRSHLCCLLLGRALREANFSMYVKAIKQILPWFFALDHGRKKRKASSGSNSDTSPKQETKRNNLDEKGSFPTKSFKAEQIEQDETRLSSSDMWKVPMRMEDCLINDFKALQRYYNELRASHKQLSLQAKMEAMEKNNLFVLRENMSNMESKLQESLMKNVLLEEKIHEMNSKHDDLEQYNRKYNLGIDGIPEVYGDEDIVIKLTRSIDADVGPEDIDIVYRFKKGKRQPNPILNILNVRRK